MPTDADQPLSGPSHSRPGSPGIPRRVAFFGGSFDPPHLGHVAIATAAADHFELDQVLFAPVADQPLKTKRALASFADRLAMVELACAGDARFCASAIDAARPDGGPNYTIDTLRRLRSQLAWHVDLFSLVGADAFLDLPRWRDPDGLLAICEWIVASRPGFALPAAAAPQTQRIHVLDWVEVDISATAIRAALQATAQGRGESMAVEAGPLPSAVELYIRQHRLYGAA